MKTISLTVPMDYNALTRASDMLHGLALDLNREEGKVADEAPKPTTAATAPAPDAQTLTTSATPAPTATDAATSGTSDNTEEDDQPTPEPDAASVFGGPKLETAPTTATVPAGPGETSTEATADATTENTQAGQPAESTATPPGIDLAPSVNTGTLIPWDARIHAGSKAKLAKKPHGWKMKRGVSDELVDQVEAELIAAMKASPANPAESTPAPPAIEPTPAAPAQPAAPTGAVTTFPALMSAITSNKIDPATVTAAVNKAGLQSLPLLAARPDLIPAVAAELGFGG
jgi:hypothetical protein